MGRAGAAAARLAASGGPAVRAAGAPLGLEVHAWTVDEPARMRELLDLGVDGLVTDRPELLRDVLRERLGADWDASASTRQPRSAPDQP